MASSSGASRPTAIKSFETSITTRTLKQRRISKNLNLDFKLSPCSE